MTTDDEVGVRSKDRKRMTRIRCFCGYPVFPAPFIEDIVLFHHIYLVPLL